MPWCWCPWPCRHAWCSVNVYHFGLGDLCIRSSGVCPCSCISLLRPLPPGSWTSVVLEADLCGPALIPVAHPVTARSLSFLELRVHGGVAAPQGCGEREWRLRLTHNGHTCTHSTPSRNTATHAHTHTQPPVSMHVLTPTHTLCTHTHTRVHSGTHMPSPTHTHTDTTHSLTLTRRGTGPDLEHPSKPQAGPGRLPLSAVAVSSLVP